MHRWLVTIAVILLTLGAIAIPPSAARSVRVEALVPQIYQQLPNFPRENTYHKRQGDKVDADNTLLNRLVRYHVYVKGRPQNLRLDWKHTIADYLGVNETIDPATYPTQERLTDNPLEGDRAVITKLSRRDREQLIQTLIAVLSPPSPNPQLPSRPPAPPLAPNPDDQPRLPRTAPQPGGADLLK